MFWVFNDTETTIKRRFNSRKTVAKREYQSCCFFLLCVLVFHLMVKDEKTNVQLSKTLKTGKVQSSYPFEHDPIQENVIRTLYTASNTVTFVLNLGLKCNQKNLRLLR